MALTLLQLHCTGKYTRLGSAGQGTGVLVATKSSEAGAGVVSLPKLNISINNPGIKHCTLQQNERKCTVSDTHTNKLLMNVTTMIPASPAALVDASSATTPSILTNDTEAMLISLWSTTEQGV